MGQQQDARPVVAQVLNGGQGRLDATRVGNDPAASTVVGKGDVEVHSNDHDMAGDLEVIQARHAHGVAPTSPTRSTRRLL